MSSAESLVPELLRSADVAKLVNAGERSIWRWSRSGRMPRPVRIGAAVRFRRSEILAWLEGGCKPVDGRDKR